jgi:multisubunit Na+/H+ antiporter MnhE subunit
MFKQLKTSLFIISLFIVFSGNAITNSWQGLILWIIGSISLAALTNYMGFNQRVNLIKLLAYLPWLYFEIIKSSINVSLLLILRRKLTPYIIDIDISALNHLQKVLYANSITLTPGTVSIDISESKLKVHVLASSLEAGLYQTKQRVLCL